MIGLGFARVSLEILVPSVGGGADVMVSDILLQRLLSHVQTNPGDYHASGQ